MTLASMSTGLRLPDCAKSGERWRAFVNRKQFSSTLVSGVGIASIQPAFALGEFDALRSELDGTGSGGLQRLEKLLDAEDYPEVIKFTKEYFIYVGKGIMTSARKGLSDETKAAAKELYNQVQEDLIAINKLSRPKGQENKPEAQRYLALLKEDMRKFLDLDPTTR